MFIISNDIVPSLGMPVAAPGLRAFGLAEGLRANGASVKTLVVKGFVDRQWMRFGKSVPHPMGPDTEIVGGWRLSRYLRDPRASHGHPHQQQPGGQPEADTRHQVRARLLRAQDAGDALPPQRRVPREGDQRAQAAQDPGHKAGRRLHRERGEEGTVLPRRGCSRPTGTYASCPSRSSTCAPRWCWSGPAEDRTGCRRARQVRRRRLPPLVEHARELGQGDGASPRPVRT